MKNVVICQPEGNSLSLCQGSLRLQTRQSDDSFTFLLKAPCQSLERAMVKNNITAVCISGIQESWRLTEIPFLCYTAGYEYFPHYPPVKTKERIMYLSQRRNNANRAALELYPDTQHFLSIDTYYLNYINEIHQLLREYSDYDGDCILGASNWYLDYSKIPAKIRYWDQWATPEMMHRRYDYYPRTAGLPEGWERVRGCGGFTLYPRWVWEKRGYGIPEPFPEAGNEVNYLCECPGIFSYVTLNVKALRHTPPEVMNRSLLARIRTTVGLRTRLGLKTTTKA